MSNVDLSEVPTELLMAEIRARLVAAGLLDREVTK